MTKYMKTKIRAIYMILFISLLTGPFFMACDKDDNDTFSIIGSWNIDKVVHNEGTEHGNDTATFFSDGTGHVDEQGEEPDNFTWSLNGSIITQIWDENFEQKFEIIEKGESKMVWDLIDDDYNLLVYFSRIN